MQRKHVLASSVFVLVGAASIATADPTNGGNYVETNPYTYVFVSGTPIPNSDRPVADAYGFGVPASTPYIAHEPTPSWYELGVVASRFDRQASAATGSGALTSKGVRFSLAAGIAKHLYVGADAEFGKVGDDLTVAGDPIAGRSSTSTSDNTGGPVSGEYGIARVVAGTSVDLGILHLGGELAMGVRYADYGTAEAAVLGTDLTSQTDALVEGRARADVFVTPRITVGAVAGVDLRNHDDVSLCVAVGMRFSNKD